MAMTEMERARDHTALLMSRFITNVSSCLSQVDKASHMAKLKSRNGEMYTAPLMRGTSKSQHEWEQG